MSKQIRYRVLTNVGTMFIKAFNGKEAEEAIKARKGITAVYMVLPEVNR